MAEPEETQPEQEETGQEQPEVPLPGTAAMAQGQPGAGVEPPDADKPGQPDKLPTGEGGAALAEQQQNPDLEDNNGARP